MPHEVFNLGTLTGPGRFGSRQFIAGIEPGREIVLGRSRRRKKMLVLLDAWIEMQFFDAAESNDFQPSVGKFSLAVGKDPLNTALLFPVGTVSMFQYSDKVGATDQPNTGASPTIEQLFHAQGWMGAVKEVAIDFFEVGTVTVDVDVHLDWGVAEVDWWTWFVSWNNLEASPDGNLVDGDRAYS